MTKALTAKMDAAVARGVRWMDKNRPGWAHDIDLRDLDMGSPTQCVLGHCFGDFWRALSALGKPNDNERAIRYGFNAPGSNGEEGAPNGAYEYLALTWAPYIAVRQVKPRQEVR